MSEHWTPAGRDEPDDDSSAGAGPGGAGQAGAEADPRLAEVSAWLASAPVPTLPDGVEARISAALATEAAARSAQRVRSGDDELGPDEARATGEAQAEAAGPPAGAPAPGPARSDRTLGSAPARARVRRSRGLGRRMLRGGPLLLVVLVLAGTGFLISRGSSSSSSSSAASGSAAGSANSGSSSAVSAPAAAGSASSTAGPGAGQQTSGSSGQSVVFRVTESGVSYRRATLAQQVAARLHGSSSSTGEHSPPAALYACVLHFTGGSTPVLVDQATYQGTPVYVVVSSSRVWVVGRGCTPAKTELVASVPVAG